MRKLRSYQFPSVHVFPCQSAKETDTLYSKKIKIKSLAGVRGWSASTSLLCSACVVYRKEWSLKRKKESPLSYIPSSLQIFLLLLFHCHPKGIRMPLRITAACKRTPAEGGVLTPRTFERPNPTIGHFCSECAPRKEHEPKIYKNKQPKKQ